MTLISFSTLFYRIITIFSNNLLELIFLYIQTGLNLLTTNTSSDQSMVDDGISPAVEDKRAKSEVRP